MDCTEVPLPINQCVGKMIASMENNHITIPGFYDNVEELSTEPKWPKRL
jgi:hypothetical protein